MPEKVPNQELKEKAARPDVLPRRRPSPNLSPSRWNSTRLMLCLEKEPLLSRVNPAAPSWNRISSGLKRSFWR